MDFYLFLGYFSGLLFIKPEMDATTLLRTAALVHLLDAILCGVIAWTVAGLLGGIWALGILFLLPTRSLIHKSAPTAQR